MERIISLKLSAQRALLGEVAPNLRALTAGLEGPKILVWAYYDPPATDLEIERVSCIAAEIIADFPEPYYIEEKVFFTKEEKLPMLDFWALVREDTSTD